MRLVADHELVRGARDLADVAREPGVGLDRDRVRPPRRRALEDRVGEPVGVAVLGQVAPELVDEQPAVGEDQDALGARRLDEAGGGDRLAGGGRVAEAVAARSARIRDDRDDLVVVLVAVRVRERQIVLVLVVLLDELADEDVAVAVPVPVPDRLLVRGDQLGEHPGERVHLVAAQLGAGGEPGGLLGEDAVEAEHERVADAPLRRRLEPAGVHLRERGVERTADSGPRREHDLERLVRLEERLSGPCFRPKGRGCDAVRCLQRSRRVRECLLQCARHVLGAASLGRARGHPHQRATAYTIPQKSAAVTLPQGPEQV